MEQYAHERAKRRFLRMRQSFRCLMRCQDEQTGRTAGSFLLNHSARGVGRRAMIAIIRGTPPEGAKEENYG